MNYFYFLNFIIAAIPFTTICMEPHRNKLRESVLANLSYTPHPTAEKDTYYKCIPSLHALAMMTVPKEQLDDITIQDLHKKTVSFQQCCKKMDVLCSYDIQEFKYKSMKRQINDILDKFAPMLMENHILNGLEFLLAHTTLTKESRNKLLDYAQMENFLKGMYLITAWLTIRDFLEGSFLNNDKTSLKKTIIEHALVASKTEESATTLDKTAEKAITNLKTSDELTTAMTYALYYNDPYILNFVIQCGAKIPGKDYFDWTPLHMAARNNSVDCALLLLSNNADVNAKDEDNYTPLHHASQKGCSECTALLLSHSAKVNAKDRWGCTPLHYTSSLRSSECRDILLSNGAKINAKDISGNTPLHMSINNESSTNNTKILLEYGAEVNVKNHSGDTPLHTAARKKSLESTKILLSYGADVTAKNAEGQTPLDYALEKKHTEILQILEHAATPVPSSSSSSTN